jgi:hypothetical protein
MMWRWSIVLGVLLAAFAAPLPAAEGEQAGEPAADAEAIEFPPEIQKLLTEPSDDETYRPEERCISTRSIRRTHILDDRHIVFESAGSSYYLVQFQRRCPRLNKHSTLIYEASDGRLCRLDMIRPSSGAHDISPPCSIPGFIPITGEQVVLLRETLEARKAASRG